MAILSVRVPYQVDQKLIKWAKMEKKDKSTAARELMEYGWTFVFLEQYRQGKISLGNLAQELRLSISETMDLVVKYGIQVHLDYEDYLTGLENLRK